MEQELADDISDAGLAVMANPLHHISNSELKRIEESNRQRELRKKNKEERRQLMEQRFNDRQSVLSSRPITPIPQSFEREDTSMALKSSQNQNEIPVSINFEEQSRIDHDIGSNQSTTPIPSRKSSIHSIHSINDAMSTADIKEYIAESVKEAVQKNRQMNDYYEDDIDFRLRNMNKQGIEYSRNFNVDTANKQRKEMEHWRMKLSLEEKELEQNCSTFIAVGADILEGICDAIDFKAFETKNLSEEMDAAIKQGRFNTCVKQYASMGGGKFMRNPVLNFLTTFSSVALKNHLQQKKTRILKPENHQKRRGNRSAPAATASATGPAAPVYDYEFENHRPQYQPYYQIPPHGYARAQHHPHHYGRQFYHPSDGGPALHNQQHYRPTPCCHQHAHGNEYGNTNTTTTAAASTNGAPIEQKHISPSTSSQSRPVLQTQPKAKEEEKEVMITDPATGETRVMMQKMGSTIPIEDISESINKFNPVLKHVKENMINHKKLEKAKQELEKTAPKKNELFD